MDHNLLKDAVASSYSLKQTLETLGYKNGGSTRYRIKALIEELAIDISHFGTHRATQSSAFDNVDKLADAVATSTSFAAVIRKFGMSASNGSYSVLQNRIAKYNISTAHFSSKPVRIYDRLPLSDILVENSTYTGTYALKKRLVAEGLLKYECSGCNNVGEWRNKPLTLQLEHKNGVSNDHRIENLEFLCPNCHTQTPTYAGKKRT